MVVVDEQDDLLGEGPELDGGAGGVDVRVHLGEGAEVGELVPSGSQKLEVLRLHTQPLDAGRHRGVRRAAARRRVRSLAIEPLQEAHDLIMAFSVPDSISTRSRLRPPAVRAGGEGLVVAVAEQFGGAFLDAAGLLHRPPEVVPLNLLQVFFERKAFAERVFQQVDVTARRVPRRWRRRCRRGR